MYQWDSSGKTAAWIWSLVLLLQAAQTFSLEPSECVVLAVMKCGPAQWQELTAQGTLMLVKCIGKESQPQPVLSSGAMSQNLHSCIAIRLHWSDSHVRSIDVN